MGSLTPDAGEYYAAGLNDHDENTGDAPRRARIYLGMAVIGMLSGAAGIVTAGVIYSGHGKEYVPVPVVIDKSTGLVDVIENVPDITAANTSIREAIDRHFVNGYVMARESWSQSNAELQQRYRTAMLLSDSSVGQQAGKEFRDRAENWSDRLSRDVQITAIKNLETSAQNGTAYVEFTITDTWDNEEGQDPDINHWTGIVSYVYAAGPISAVDRLQNFAGFQVQSYRRELRYTNQ